MLFIAIMKINGFKSSFQKEELDTKDTLIISFVFSFLAILSTYNGIEIQGSIANTRIISIVSGGILFGPKVGIISGVVAGLHRYLIDINGITSIQCLVSSVFAGIISGVVGSQVSKEKKAYYGIICGVLSETMTMLLIGLFSRPHYLAMDIIQKICIPMIIGQVGIGILITIVQSIIREKDEVAAFQSKLALDVANKTLPYFRNVNSESLTKVCEIIKTEIKCDAVSITDNKKVVAYVGIGEEDYKIKERELSEQTQMAILENKILNIKSSKSFIKTSMIIPLTDSNGVVGALKIYYSKKYEMTHSQKSLAVGLSQLISTQMEISKIASIEDIKNKAEIKALQTQINPHFLFNALNTITSFIRINPDKARQLIINLSTYMRYNIERNDDLININEEIYQVKAYVEIEKARFNEKLNVIYDIDEDINVKIPSLIIQPLVENALQHGILKNNGRGSVNIRIKKENQKVKISVTNDGVTIDSQIIDKLKYGKMPSNKIGLYNVHLRLKLIYGQGLKIKQLSPGTHIEFII